MNCENCGLKFYTPQAAGDGEFYNKLQNYKGYYLKEKAEFQEASKYISNTDDVLEIGCGEGLLTNYISYKTYTGLEFSDKAIITATGKGLKVTNESIEVHAIKNANKYDVVCYFQVL
ncbi:MAG: class I SAM-dependent methyltransferase [Chitinophagaceae bacterium]|nr:class I SAM-dependent methyltransferase [Chitinophagaceae bacterium]